MAGYTALPTKNPGDLLTSALWNTYLQGNAASGFARMLADTTLGASAASILFSSIDANFAHLLLVGLARGDTAASTTTLLCRFNGDSGANYSWQNLQGSAAAALASNAAAQTAATLSANLAAATTVAGVFTSVLAIIPNHASGTPSKDTIALNLYASTPTLQVIGNHWGNVAAINSITLLPGAGNFITGTRFTLYGLPH